MIHTVHKPTPHRLLGDQPKESLTDDRLGHAGFARALARSICEIGPGTGIVLAIHGAWGMGKTTAVNMTIDAVAEFQAQALESNRIIVVKFNPWWFSGQHDLTRAYFTEITLALGTNVSSKVRDGLKRLAKKVASAKDVISAVLQFAPGGPLISAVGAEVLSTAGNAIADESSLEDERRKLCDALLEEGRRILVIIDDVDRLPPDEARQIFRLVKSVADLPNIIYLLVFDRDIARRALEEPAEPSGPEWLEKIVQASFDLPPVQATDLQQLFLEGMQDIIGTEESFDRRYWGNVFFAVISVLLRTPRDVRKLLNALSVSWAAVAGEVNVADFVAIEALRLFEPRLYAAIRRHSGNLVGLELMRVGELDRSIGERLLQQVTRMTSDQAKDALHLLFPRLGSMWGRGGYTSEFLGIWDGQLRVCSPRRFPAYFNFNIGDEVLPRAELDSFLHAIADRQVVRATIEAAAATPRKGGGTKAAVLLEEFGSSLDRIDDESLFAATENFLDAGDLFLSAADEGRGMYDIPRIWRVGWVAKRLLLRQLEIDRVAAVSNAVRSGPSLQTAAFLIQSFARALGRGLEAGERSEGEKLVGEAALDELEANLLKRFRVEAADGRLLQRDMMPLLHHWAQLGGQEEVRSWTNTKILDNEAALRIAETATQIVRSHIDGDYVVQISPQVNRSVLERVVDVGRLLSRLDEIDHANEEDTRSESIIRRFREGLQEED